MEQAFGKTNEAARWQQKSHAALAGLTLQTTEKALCSGKVKHSENRRTEKAPRQSRVPFPTYQTTNQKKYEPSFFTDVGKDAALAGMFNLCEENFTEGIRKRWHWRG